MKPHPNLTTIAQDVAPGDYITGVSWLCREHYDVDGTVTHIEPGPTHTVITTVLDGMSRNRVVPNGVELEVFDSRFADRKGC